MRTGLRAVDCSGHAAHLERRRLAVLKSHQRSSEVLSFRVRVEGLDLARDGDDVPAVRLHEHAHRPDRVRAAINNHATPRNLLVRPPSAVELAGAECLLPWQHRGIAREAGAGDDRALVDGLAGAIGADGGVAHAGAFRPRLK